MNDGLHRLVAPLGRRLLARSRRVVGASGLTLARAVRERRRPKLLGDSTRLALGRSLARRRVERPVQSGERPPGMSDFAAEVLFGTEPPAGTPFEEALPFLEEQFSSPAPSDEAQPAAPRAAREHVTQPLPRGRVHEAGRFKLSRHPAPAASSEPVDKSDGEAVVDEVVVEQPAPAPKPVEVPFAEEDAAPAEHGVIARTEAAPTAEPGAEAVPVPVTGAASTPVPPSESGPIAGAPVAPRPLVVARKRTAPGPERPLLRMRRIEPRAPTPVEAVRPESPQPPPTIAQRLLRFFRPSPEAPAREERAPAPDAAVHAAPLVVARTPAEPETPALTPGSGSEPTVEAEPVLPAAPEPSSRAVLRRVYTFLGRSSSPEPGSAAPGAPTHETRAAPPAPPVEQPPEPVSEVEEPTPEPASLAVSQSQPQPEADAEQEPTPTSAPADEEEEEEERAVVLASAAEETFSEPERLEAETQPPSATPVARLLTRVRRAGRTFAARRPVESPPPPQPLEAVRPAQLPQPEPLSGSRARARVERDYHDHPDYPGPPDFVESEPEPQRAVLQLETIAPAAEQVEEPEPVRAPVLLRSVTTRPATRRTISRRQLPVREPPPTLWERAVASGVAATHEPSGVTTVTFPPPAQAALATTEHELVAREPAAAAELPVSTPAPTAAAAPAPAAAGAPGGGDFDELYERVVDRLRRDLLADRERMGDLLGDGP